MAKKKKEKENNNVLGVEEITISQREFDFILNLANNVDSDEYIIEVSGTDDTQDEPAMENNSQPAKLQIKQQADGKGKIQEENCLQPSNQQLSLTPETTGFDNIKNYSLNDTEHVHRKWRNADKIGLMVINNISDYHSIANLIFTWKEFLSPNAKVAVAGSDKPGPSRAAREVVSDGGNFKIYKKFENLTVITKDKCVHHWLIDANEIGTCRFCNRKRDFRKLMKRATSSSSNRKKKTKI